MTYGFEVYNSAGLLLLDSSTDKQPTCIVSGTTTVAGSGTSSSITCSGMTTTNSDEIVVLLYDEPTSAVGASVTVTRQTGSFTLTNPLGTSATLKWVALRY